MLAGAKWWCHMGDVAVLPSGKWVQQATKDATAVMLCNAEMSSLYNTVVKVVYIAFEYKSISLKCSLDKHHVLFHKKLSYNDVTTTMTPSQHNDVTTTRIPASSISTGGWFATCRPGPLHSDPTPTHILVIHLPNCIFSISVMTDYIRRDRLN